MKVEYTGLEVPISKNSMGITYGIDRDGKPVKMCANRELVALMPILGSKKSTNANGLVKSK